MYAKKIQKGVDTILNWTRLKILSVSMLFRGENSFRF